MRPSHPPRTPRCSNLSVEAGISEETFPSPFNDLTALSNMEINVHPIDWYFRSPPQLTPLRLEVTSRDVDVAVLTPLTGLQRLYISTKEKPPSTCRNWWR